jgi:UDP-N-acetylglucosamine 1-carboxyvinyltransferase
MKFLIKNPEGKYDIDGTIFLQGSKNAMMNNLLLPLLTDDECVFYNVPKIKDIEINLEFLKTLNAKVEWIDNHTVLVQCDDIKYNDQDALLSAKTTGSKYFIPFMVKRFGEFKMGSSGGDKLGNRGFENYANSLKSFGIEYKINDQGLYHFYKIDFHKSEISLPFQSIGLTVNAIFAALNCSQDTLIHNACIEAEIDNTIELINQMGGNVMRVTPHEILITVTNQLHGGKFRNMSDRNAAVTYSIMALITNGRLEIQNYDDVKMDAFYSFLDSLGANYELKEKTLTINKSEFLKSNHNLRIKAFIYPDIHSDWQPLIAPLLTQMNGISYIEEYLFPDRLRYWKELEKMGVSYQYDLTNKTRFENDPNPHAVKVSGKFQLKGAEVEALDLRGGVALIIAALVAKGTTTINNADEILRGYENIDTILKGLSVDICYTK